jgi:hypothetical protein
MPILGLAHGIIGSADQRPAIAEAHLCWTRGKWRRAVISQCGPRCTSWWAPRRVTGTRRVRLVILHCSVSLDMFMSAPCSTTVQIMVLLTSGRQGLGSNGVHTACAKCDGDTILINSILELIYSTLYCGLTGARNSTESGWIGSPRL